MTLRTLTLGLALLVAGCASTSEWPEPTEQPERFKLTDVPFHPQERYQCGPAALATMFGAQGIEASPQSLVERVYLPERGGTLQVEMVSAARERGLVSYPLASEFESLLSEVSAGNPVLIMQNLRFQWWPQWHYAVVIGYDRGDDALLLHTDTREAHPQPRRVFLRSWERADQWARVMLPPDQLPATAEPLPWIRAVSDLEAIGQLDAARTGYETALQQWPQEPAPRFGLGNIAYQQDDAALAARHFLKLTATHPELAAGWNNLAVVLDEIGCEQAASTSRQCYQALADEDGEVQPSAQLGIDGACPVLTCPAH